MSRHQRVESWLMAGIDAVDPATLTRVALAHVESPLTVLAIGKAAAGMCRGAAAAAGPIQGLCVTSHDEPIPDGIELITGDHPLPGTGSLAAGEKALEIAGRADVALISGGGSSLCEVPAPGLTMEFVADVYRSLLEAGTNILEVNLVRAHLSQTKGGGLGPIPTYVLSDVAGQGPEVVSSGPTIGMEPDPERALSIMRRAGIFFDARVEGVVRRVRPTKSPPHTVEVVGDGRTAANAVVTAVDEGVPARVADGWVEGGYLDELSDFIRSAEPGVTVAAGEPSVPARGEGRGGRNTHTALAAARMIAGEETTFAALATDGSDGSSGSAGAIVDGTTIDRAGDPDQALAIFDSAPYLERSGDLIHTGPTGTNVADLWLIWKPADGPELY